ncbi:uncharacterized protein MICPUCDRAFT_22347, partial [Micromonas pusilla CCMP1545]
MLAPVGAANQHPKCVDDSGLCGPDFGGRVCDAGRYCVGGMCRADDKCGPDHGNTICPGNRVC